MKRRQVIYGVATFLQAVKRNHQPAGDEMV